MARLKNKFEKLGRPIRPLTITSRDGSQELEVFYQRPTVHQDRILREMMRMEYEQAVKTFDEHEEGSETQRERLLKECRNLGKAKTIQFIVANDIDTIRVQALRMIGREPLDPDASEEDKKAFMDEFMPAFDEARKEIEASFEDQEAETLYSAAVDAQIESAARNRAFEMYRKRLILDSLIEQDENDNSKYVPIFDSIDEIELLMAPEVLEDTAGIIAEELRKVRELPLKSVETT